MNHYGLLPNMSVCCLSATKMQFQTFRRNILTLITLLRTVIASLMWIHNVATAHVLTTALHFCFSCTALQAIFVFLLDLSTFSHIHLHFVLFVLCKCVSVECSCVSVCSYYSQQCVEVERAFCARLFVCVYMLSVGSGAMDRMLLHKQWAPEPSRLSCVSFPGWGALTGDTGRKSAPGC